MEDYNLVMFTHAMDFFNKFTRLKKSILNVVVLPFGVVLAYLIVPKSPLPGKWSNQKQNYHIRLKHRKKVDHYMLPTRHAS
jgi:hypothetical protein